MENKNTKYWGVGKLLKKFKYKMKNKNTKYRGVVHVGIRVACSLYKL